MGLARTLAVTLTGLDGQLVEVECDIAAGLPALTFTGRADTSVTESRDRMKAAMANSGVEWPTRRITVALLPADLPKTGSRFDLAICLAVLAADGRVPHDAVDGAVWIAELGLDGRLRAVRGVLPAVLAARRSGARRVVVAEGNAAEAALVDGMDVRAATSLRQVLDWLTGEGAAPPVAVSAVEERVLVAPDLVDVGGQGDAKRAVEIAAAGGHHLLLVGAPGSGKTMLAERLPGLLPPLTDDDAIAVTALHSIAGALPPRAGLIRRPPFQAPHHTASIASIVGGGPRVARPGAISLAHAGVLFLDEASEFPSRALDALRQPLESGDVHLHRQGGAVCYPARFQLVLAANPCACTLTAGECTCQPQDRRRYERRLSGPLRDRIDIRVKVARVAHHELLRRGEAPPTTAEVAARVAAAREGAAERLRATLWRSNAEVPGWWLRAPERLPGRAALSLAEDQLDKGSLSPRGFDRVLRIAWTIADLSGVAVPGTAEMSEALFHRIGEAAAWAA